MLTKTISLADDAYEALAAAKRPGESFSDLARRLAREDALHDLFDPEIRIPMSDAEAQARLAAIYKARDDSVTPRHPS